jgi:hypothetical protein
MKVSTYQMFRNEHLIVIQDNERVYKYYSLDGAGMSKIIRAVAITLKHKAVAAVKNFINNLVIKNTL